MEKVLISTIPGIAFACSFFLLFLSLIQFKIYLNKGYKRSRSLALFCFFSALFSFEHFVAQSRIFSPEFTHAYVAVSTFALCLSLLTYLQSLNFFVAIPNRFYQVYCFCAMILAIATGLATVASIFGDHSLFFNPDQILETQNYFVNSYTTRFGTPSAFLNVLLSISSVITTITAIFLLSIVLRSSQDRYFIAGLVLSITAATMENFLLPFTYAYFFPVVFMANMFEAFRMNSLSYREYTKEKKDLLEEQAKEEVGEKYQNSNLSDERVGELAEKLKHVLAVEKAYLNPNLLSEDLAKKIEIPTYQLSQVINIGLNTTFFELISQYRIDEVKRRLKDEKFTDETIINIAYESGFNSKSAFNTAFKKQTGVTPSVFRKNN